MQCLDDAIARAKRQNCSNRMMCGNCHLRTGHTRRNCTFDSCNSARSCGDIDKHCDEKARRRKLTSEIASLETHLKSTIDVQHSSKKTHEKLEESFAARIEQDIIDTNPNLYIQNGIKNWSLIHKHVAVLENLCQGKLPRRNEIPRLLKTGLNKCTKNLEKRSIHDNPRKEILIDHGIKFPKRSKLTDGSSPSSFSSKQEQEDFVLAIELQNALNQSSKIEETNPVTTQPAVTQHLFPSVNQQIHVLVPCDGTKQLSNWNQENFDSAINNHTITTAAGIINHENRGTINMRQTAHATPIYSNRTYPPLAPAVNCLDILAHAALSETISPGCEEDEYYSDE